MKEADKSLAFESREGGIKRVWPGCVEPKVPRRETEGGGSA